MAYTYIPQFFPTGFFEESQLVATLISKKIRLRGSVRNQKIRDNLIHRLGLILAIRLD